MERDQIRGEIKSFRRKQMRNVQEVSQLKAELRAEIRQHILDELGGGEREDSFVVLLYRRTREMLDSATTSDIDRTIALLAELQLREFCNEFFSDAADSADEEIGRKD